MEIPKWLGFLRGYNRLPERNLILPEVTIRTTDITQAFTSTYRALNNESMGDKSNNEIYWKIKRFMDGLIDINGLDPLMAYQIAQTDSGISMESGTHRNNYQRIFRPQFFDLIDIDNALMSETTRYEEDIISKSKCVLMSTFHTTPKTRYGISHRIYGEHLIRKKTGGYNGLAFTLHHSYTPEGLEESTRHLEISKELNIGNNSISDL
jgi:hypothetical protein